jgi:hypothetical protein
VKDALHRVVTACSVAVIAAATAAGGAAPAVAAPARPAGCSIARALPPPPKARPRYVLRVRVQPGLGTVRGTLTVAFTAPADRGTDGLVFRLWPNGPVYAGAGAHLAVSDVREARRSLPISHPDATTLVVRRPVRPGSRVVVSMRWRLSVPAGLSQLRIAREGVRALRLGSFFPLLAWDGRGWALDPPTRLTGESWTSPTADFDVRVSAPRGLRAFATGEQVAPGVWRARAVRDFALALGHFGVATGVAHVPAPVKVTVAADATAYGSPNDFLQPAITSLQRLSARYGSYPWSAYTVVAMADIGAFAGGGSNEYPTLVFVSATDATPVAHETAHQWFYSLVGNDQARDPWLDEGLATWAQTLVDAAPPFANARIPAAAADRIGEPMRFWDRLGFRRFFLGVYLQTYRSLKSLGPRAQVDCALRAYVQQNAYRVARPADLLTALQRVFPAAKQELEAHGAHF